jgi:hypothetical protein
VTKRAEYVFALYAGSVADPGDRNPYAGRSLVLAKLWMRGYMRMLEVQVNGGLAIVNGQVAIPAGGRIKVPTPCGDS